MSYSSKENSDKYQYRYPVSHSTLIVSHLSSHTAVSALLLFMKIMKIHQIENVLETLFILTLRPKYVDLQNFSILLTLLYIMLYKIIRNFFLIRFYCYEKLRFSNLIVIHRPTIVYNHVTDYNLSYKIKCSSKIESYDSNNNNI